MLKWLTGLWVLLALSGCARQPSHSSANTKLNAADAPADPVQALFEKVRSGSYQISSAIDSIEEVRKTVKTIAARETGDTHQALLTVGGQVDEAGKALADFGNEPAGIEDFRDNFSIQDERRLKAIDAANQALDDLKDAQDLLGDLLDSNPPEPENTELSKADSDLDTCIMSIEDAIKSMGGRVTIDDP